MLCGDGREVWRSAYLRVRGGGSPGEGEQGGALVEARVRRMNVESKAGSPGEIELNF